MEKENKTDLATLTRRVLNITGAVAFLGAAGIFWGFIIAGIGQKLLGYDDNFFLGVLIISAILLFIVYWRHMPRIMGFGQY